MQKYFFRILTVLTLLCGGVIAVHAESHLVMPGETLYSLSQKYQVTQEALIAANPMLKDGLKAGMLLQIPASDVGNAETVPEQGDPAADQKKSGKERRAIQFTKLRDRKKGEPLQVESDTESYNPTPEDLKPAEATPSDSSLTETVPGRKDVTPATPTVAETFPAEPYNRRDSYVHIAVAMPFNLQSQTRNEDKQQRRSVEFYQGLLIAANEAQQEGKKVEVSAFDIGTETTESILANQNFQHADMVIAPFDANDAQPYIDYGRRSGVNVVSPLAFSEENLNEPHLFQLNTTKGLLYPQLNAEIISRFGEREIVFLTDSSLLAIGKEESLVPTLKERLTEEGLTFHQFTYTDPSRLSFLDAELNVGDKPMLLIPTSATRESMRRMFPCLKYLTAETDSTKAHDVAILGYPEWMLYTEEFMNYYYDMNVWMFSKFYANPLDPRVGEFYRTFKYWYGKEPMNLFPKYGLLGYDVARFFIERINMSGWTFDQTIAHSCNEGSLQNVMNFEHTEQGGWINSALCLVHFKPSTEIEKYVVR